MADTVLVVDDEQDIADLVGYRLRQAGYDVVTAYDGDAAVEAARRRPPDLVVLDLMLPRRSGLEVLKVFRGAPATRGVPVIILTARSEEVDRIVGFELGADDYVVKPFSPRELVLRVQAVLKRRHAPVEAEGGLLRVGPIEMDLDNHEVRVSGRTVRLTVTEFRLLADLVRARGRVRSRDALLAEVWGYESEVLSRTVDTHVRRLRRKLGEASAWLGTLRGVGYRIQSPEGD